MLLIYFSNKTTQHLTTLKNRSSWQEARPNTETFLETRDLDTDHKTMEEHVKPNPVPHSDLDRCLLRVLRFVQRRERYLSRIASALTILLQSGAKWNKDFLLADQKTPLHIICESPGDHHVLLDLMIKSFQEATIDTQQDIDMRTALLYAATNNNIKCLKLLLALGAGDDGQLLLVHWVPYQQWFQTMEAIRIMDYAYFEHLSAILEDILDSLLVTGVEQDKTYFKNCAAVITYAASFSKFDCVIKLIKNGARLDIKDHTGSPVWAVLARLGNNEMLKCLLDYGIDKDSVDPDGLSVLWWVTTGGNVEVVRYLLDFGVAILTYPPEVREGQLLTVKDNKYDPDPYMESIRYNRLEIVKVLDEYGWQSWKSFDALRRAVTYGSVDVMSYLLNKYSYPLNMEYIHIESNGLALLNTLLTEPTSMRSVDITKVLLDHGADPTKQMSEGRGTYSNAIIAAIYREQHKIMALYIRSGVNMDYRLLDYIHGDVQPFEASVLHDRRSMAEMLLISGCSRGVFSFNNNHKSRANLTPELDKLLKEWKVQENKVIPLKQRCRIAILNHLSPRADKKIENLPLPQSLIKFLSIPELENKQI